MLLMRRDKSGNIMTKKKGVCPYLVNNSPCCAPNCPHSHKERDIRWWREHTGSKRCIYGPTCTLALAGICVFSHPREEHADRLQRMTDGLGYLGTLGLDLLSALQDRRPVGITDDRDLASFNKVSDGVIAVPGWCYPPVSVSSRASSSRLGESADKRYRARLRQDNRRCSHP